jgi:cation diffusion facilitator family transporter
VELTPQAAQRRSLAIRKTLLAILAANWLVAILKIVMGLANDLASVAADGLHSLIDGGSNVLGLVAMSVAAQPADEDHPYGHGKFEALASLGIGALMGIGMLELGQMAFNALVHDRHPTVGPGMIAVLVLTLVINIAVTTVERRIGQKLQSPVLLADARHTLSDVFVTLAVIASVVLVWMEVPKADGVVALLVLGFVAWVAYGTVQQAIGILSDQSRLDPPTVEAVVAKVPGVERCRDVRSRGMEQAVYVDLKIEVRPELTTARAHALADEVEQAIIQSFPQVVDVVVHVEPAHA